MKKLLLIGLMALTSAFASPETEQCTNILDSSYSSLESGRFDLANDKYKSAKFKLEVSKSSLSRYLQIDCIAGLYEKDSFDYNLTKSTLLDNINVIESYISRISVLSSSSL